MSQLFIRRSLVLILVLALSFTGFTPALAAPPTNDDFANAEEIASLPFVTTVDAGEATLEPGEPQTCLPTDRSVWYTFVPSETMVLIADARQGSGPKIGIFRATGSGIADLEHVQCVSPGGAITFLVEEGQTYYFQVGAVVDAPGTVEFSISEVIEIRGRILDAATGTPLSGNLPTLATATLIRVCGDGCLEYVRAVAAFEDGVFRLDFYFGEELPPGIYLIEAAASGYEARQFGPFEFTGANLDVGDLGLDALASIGSIQGRLLDPVTGKPVPLEFLPAVYLYRCSAVECFEFVSAHQPDSEGRFRFETDDFGNPIPVGMYQVVAAGDQYHEAHTEIFEVGEGEHYRVGAIRIRSFPVRISNVVPCPDLPASGGECEYSVRVWNGLGGRFEGTAWSLAYSVVPDSAADFTEFQTKVPVQLQLERGKSKVLRFRFQVPAADGAVGMGICTRMFVGRGGNAFFNTVGYRDLFCMLRNADGFASAPPRESIARIAQPAAAAVNALDVEPNNSCQTAQDLGAVPLPITMDGNLDSSLAPDIDFYRFTGTPGAPLVIDHEGEATGKGTLFDPLLGAFDSACNLIAANDDSTSLNSHLVVTIPDDGVVILAATAFPDHEFVGGGNGTYQLTLTTYTPLGSISGIVTDAESGAPLPGDIPPFANAFLQQCDDFGCFDISWQPTASDGSFRFERDFNGARLPAGDYVVVAGAEQYRFQYTERVTVAEGEALDVGVIGLTPFPIQFSNVQGCSIPPEGGVCNFSVRVTNRAPARISGRAWSVVSGFDLGSFVNFTSFQTDVAQDMRLNPGESRTLHFRFRVRGAVMDGALICPTGYFGQNPNAVFHPVGRSFLFCLVKGEDGLTLMSPQDAQAALHPIRLQQSSPDQLFSDRKKK